MDNAPWLSFFSAIIHTLLGWPVAAAIIAFLLRHQLQALLGRLIDMELPGGARFKFTQEGVTRLIADAAKPSPAASVGDQPEQPGTPIPASHPSATRPSDSEKRASVDTERFAREHEEQERITTGVLKDVGTSSELPNEVQRAVVRGIVENFLTPLQQQIVSLYYSEGRSVPQISRQIGIPMGMTAQAVNEVKELVRGVTGHHP